MSDSGIPAALRVDVDPSGDLVVHGDIDIAGGPILDAALVEFDGDVPLVLDLSDVSFVDSSGLRSLLSASQRASERSERVTLRGVRPEVLRLLEITGTDGLFDLEPGR
jgi:anti-sigma B factor antagonist